MILLYPRLPHAIATTLAQQCSTASLADARELANTSHPSTIYAATGGMRIQESSLVKLAASIRELSRESGYPDAPSTMAKGDFDGRLGKLLHETSGLSPSEACRDGVWSFLACVLVPDVVRWRFFGVETTPKNFMGRDRGIDNALGRCWWAAELLREDQSPDDPYELLLELGVDERVGFSRRSRAIVNRRVAVTLARTVLTIHQQGVPLARLDLMRDAMKQFLRLASIACFESLSDPELERSFWHLVSASASRLAAARKRDYSPPEPPVFAGPTVQPVAVKTETEVEVDPTLQDPNQTITELLAGIDVDSRGPSRFAALKDWLGTTFTLDPAQVAIKRLKDAKNYRNRIGEALRHHPSLALLLLSGDESNVLAAVRSRLHLSPDSILLLCEEQLESPGWVLTTIIGPPADPLGTALGRMIPGAKRQEISVEDDVQVELPADIEAHIVETLATLPLGESDVVATVEQMLETQLDSLGARTRTKRIVDQKNVGNRISEGLGKRTTVLLLGTRLDLLDSTVEHAEDQNQHGQATIVIVLAEDEEGRLAHAPVILSHSQARGDETDEAEVEADESAPAQGALDRDTPVELDTNDPELVVESSEPRFRELESLEEQALLVAQLLLFRGPLDKSTAIRIVAETLREAGRLDYQRLRTHGRIYTAILAAIEMGVRMSLLDRPRRGYVRALHESADEFSKDDWLEVVQRALPVDQPVTRYDAVRIAASWASENLGLEYKRIRGNGKIDRGVRNSFRTLIRRGSMEAASRDEIKLLVARGD